MFLELFCFGSVDEGILFCLFFDSYLVSNNDVFEFIFLLNVVVLGDMLVCVKSVLKGINSEIYVW